MQQPRTSNTETSDDPAPVTRQSPKWLRLFLSFLLAFAVGWFGLDFVRGILDAMK